MRRGRSSGGEIGPTRARTMMPVAVLLAAFALMVVVVPTTSAYTPAPLTHGRSPSELVPPARAAASAGTWVDLTGFQFNPPPGRLGAAIASDPSTGYALMFGGEIGTTALGDTWEFENSTWLPVSPRTITATNSPTPRWGASMTFDTALDSYLLFGGRNASGWLNDTWTWTAGAWSRVNGSVAPSGRAYAALVNLPVAPWNAPILFGGNGLAALNDTWTFQNGTWTNITDSLSVAPSARYGAGVAYDPVLGAALVFGGYADPAHGGTGPEADTWTFGGSGWSEVSSLGSPTPRSSPAEVYDPDSSDVLLYGGVNSQGARLGDLWAWSNSSWSELSPSENATLPARAAAAVVGRETSGAWSMLVFGGSYSTLLTGNDTWLFGSNLPLGVAGPIASRSAIDSGQNLTLATLPYGGVPPYSFSWITTGDYCGSVNSSSLSCTPSVPSSELGAALHAGVTVTDATHRSVTSANLRLFVNRVLGANLTFTPPNTVPDVGASLTITVAPSFGTPPYAFSLENLPPGCVYAKPGVYRCTLSTPGTYSVSAVVTDATGASVTTNVETLVVSQAPSSGTGSPPSLLGIGAIAAVGAVAAAAVVAYLIRRRSSGARDRPPPPPPAQLKPVREAFGPGGPPLRPKGGEPPRPPSH